MTEKFYSTIDVEIHRKRIEDAKALRLAVAARKYPCACGGIYRIASEKYHVKSVLHMKYEESKLDDLRGLVR